MISLRKARIFDAFKDANPSVAIAIVIFLLIVVASLNFDVGSENPLYPYFTNHHWREFVILMAIFIGGGLCGLLFSGTGQSGFRESASCFWVSLKDSTILVGTVGCLAFALIVWWISARATSSTDHNRYLIQHDPGGVFAAFMGLVTIIGFAYTLHDLREMRRRITTFPELIDRLSAMLNKVKDDDVVRILAYTPALGYLALEDKEFKAFERAIHDWKSNNEPRAEVICLSEKDLREWHNLFVGRQTRRKKFEEDEADETEFDEETSPGSQSRVEDGVVSPKLASAATFAGEDILDRLMAKSPKPNGITKAKGMAKRKSSQDARVKRLPFEFLPGYYFFLSSDRAIVAAPLQLPFPKGAPKKTQEKLRGTVQMLGFETNDRAIIRDLNDLYNSYKSLPSSYVAEHSEIVSADEFSKWCEDPKNREKALNELLRQFDVAKQSDDQATPLEGENYIRNQDYSKYLKPGSKTKLEVTFRVALKAEDDN